MGGRLEHRLSPVRLAINDSDPGQLKHRDIRDYAVPVLVVYVRIMYIMLNRIYIPFLDIMD